MIVVLVLASRPALADHGAYSIHGFMTYGTGELAGQVVDSDGKPLSTEIRISGANGSEQKIVSDGHGKFRAKLAGGDYSIVYTEASAVVTGQVALPRADGDTEVVEIHDTMPPAVMPRPKADPTRIQDYSSTAINKDEWTRAWLLLDVDAAGRVTRLKVLKKPGLDLDTIAVNQGLALQFEPARDRENRPIRSLVMWVFEWPQYWWLRHHDTGYRRMPPGAGNVMCRGSGPPQPAMRDCSTPNPRAMFDAPWIGHPR